LKSISGEVLLQKLKGFLHKLDLKNIVRMPRVHETLFLVLKEVLLYFGNVICKKVMASLMQIYCKPNEPAKMDQSDTVDLFIMVSVLELAYLTYKRKKVINKAALDARDDPNYVPINPEELPSEDDGIDPDLPQSEKDRFKDMTDVYDYIEDYFPPMNDMAKYISVFFKPSSDNNEYSKSLVEKYLFLEMLGFLVNCDDFGRSQLVSELKNLFSRLDSHNETLEARLSYLFIEAAGSQPTLANGLKIEDPFSDSPTESGEAADADSTRLTICNYENFEDAVCAY
jgi:hypothetical protein